ncbi:MAG: peptidyl-alpha-hydroxyglycine alpha-amidating lyase family protein [Chloroflexota bacterium]
METFGNGEYRYTLVEGWEQLPTGWTHADVAGVATDAEDRVYLFTRLTARVMVYDRDGGFVKAWGEGVFQDRPLASPHGITIGPDGAVWCVDDGNHTVKKFTPDGELLLTLGSPGVPSDTGYVGPQPGISGSTLLGTIRQGGPPFNCPTNLAFAPSGDFYVSDGYGNARVHHFSADGGLITSWGQPGTGPGQFNLPHGIGVHKDGRVFVADRENDRIQIFSPDGVYLDEWLDVQRPTHLLVGADGVVHVAELWRRVGEVSQRLGPATVNYPARIGVLAPDGRVLSRWGGGNPCDPGMLCAPHSLAIDSRGDLYVGEVTHAFAVSRGSVPPDCHTFQKFARVR